MPQIDSMMTLTRSSDPLDHSIHTVHRTVNMTAQSLTGLQGSRLFSDGQEISGHHERGGVTLTVR